MFSKQFIPYAVVFIENCIKSGIPFRAMFSVISNGYMCKFVCKNFCCVFNVHIRVY